MSSFESSRFNLVSRCSYPAYSLSGHWPLRNFCQLEIERSTAAVVITTDKRLATVD